MGSDLLIHAYGTDDTVTISDYFRYADARTFSIVLDDKTLSAEDIAAMGFAVNGSDKNDSLSGWSTNDILQGNNGDDSLYGSDGDDTLDGGTGNDRLEGGYGSDTYRFRAGHGKDTLYDYQDSSADTLIFEGATADNLTIEKVGSDLLIHAYGTDDTVTISDYFRYADARTFSIVLDDKTLSAEDILAMGFAVNGSDKNDSLSGWSTNDILQGNNGDDSLYGDDGNDTLDGGTGNDRLDGGYGSDTYRFRAGHGKDTINDYQDSKADTLIFEGATADNLTIEKVGNNLLIHAYGTDDTVTISDYFRYADARTFSIVLDDKTLSAEDIAAMGVPVHGSAKNDSLSGWNNADTLFGYDGNDSLSGNGGDDTLNGGAGDDS
ncbi:calcium-binding protein, partial [Pseudocitrobacter faecalis]|uniref:calcium-binding protein n=1 Tax=Pseudocitrobacter faecalis TaxID=1398493 RepID=UPI0039F115BB